MSKKIETAKYPWVLWFTISWRPKWFAFYWTTRGANYREYQIWKFHISIGRPWYSGMIDANQRDYGSAKGIHKTNMEHLKRPFAFLIKR